MNSIIIRTCLCNIPSQPFLVEHRREIPERSRVTRPVNFLPVVMADVDPKIGSTYVSQFDPHGMAVAIIWGPLIRTLSFGLCCVTQRTDEDKQREREIKLFSSGGEKRSQTEHLRTRNTIERTMWQSQFPYI